jgi:hypothetical protein
MHSAAVRFRWNGYRSPPCDVLSFVLRRIYGEDRDAWSRFGRMYREPPRRRAANERDELAASSHPETQSESGPGLVSRASPVQTAIRNCTGDEGRPFEFGNQVSISSHRKLLLSKAMVVSVAETPGHDPGRHG